MRREEADASPRGPHASRMLGCYHLEISDVRRYNVQTRRVKVKVRVGR